MAPARKAIRSAWKAAPGILITGETLQGTVATIQQFAKGLLGVNPLDFEKVHHIMDTISAYAPSAKAAVDIACHDLMGKKANLPLYQLLGGFRDTVQTDMTIGIDKPELMAKKAQESVALGFGTLKVKVGTGFATDIERVKSIREMVGSEIKLRLDANQAWQAKEAVKMIHYLEEYDIELVEQPVKRGDLEGLRFVKNQVQTLIMSDESCFNSQEALELVTSHSVDLVNIKLMKCGGIYEALRINSICEAAGIECMIGCMVEETNIGVTAAAHLAAAKKNITRADLDATFALAEVVIPGGIPLEATSQLQISQQPGLGLNS